jgi:hypothetical protein
MLGLLLVVAGTLVLLTTSFVNSVEDWGSFVPLSHSDPLGLIVMILGIMMTFQGMERSDRVKCRRCGTVWTPPRPTSRRNHAAR